MQIRVRDIVDVEVTEIKPKPVIRKTKPIVDHHKDYGLLMGVASLFVFLYIVTNCDFFASCIAALVEMLILLIISTLIRAPIRKGDDLGE